MAFLPCAKASPLVVPSEERFTAEKAQGMIRASERHLAPVYAPLAEYLAEHLRLAEKEGIGLDIGSGPGNLIIELCQRTRMYWINVDINPHFFTYFFEKADAAGVGGRVGAMFADVQALPFQDDYADGIVSRGSFQFWEDKVLAFREIERVLKPGGVAFIGRGFSPNLPVEEAAKIRARQEEGGKSWPRYDVSETEAELRKALDEAGISAYEIFTPQKDDAEGNTIKYGIWVEFRKWEQE
jgi:SAM-dependent methyltransferase